MCLSVPAEVLSINGDRSRVSVGGVEYNAGLQLVEDVSVGDFILIHSGYAIQKIDKEEAEKTFELFNSIIEKPVNNEIH